MNRTLVVTNDFPPRPGGIQAYVLALVTGLSPESVVVYAPSWPGDVRHDAALPYPVIRHPGSLMLPEPSVLRRARRIVREYRCTSVLYGAAAPLALLTPGLRTSGVNRFVALTHGHEAGWSALPGARSLLRRIGDEVDVVTYVSEYTRRRIASALSGTAATRMAHLPPGVDAVRFAPDAAGARIRQRLGLTDRPVVVCVSRLVPRKGQDVLVRAWPLVLRRVPSAVLLLVGGGPYRHRLERLVDAVGVRASVRLTGSVSWEDLPAHYAAGDVFAMPGRSRLGGLDTEGLGLALLEAAATGLPVIAGAAGGAREAVRHGETGYVVDGTSAAVVAHVLTVLLADPRHARVLGERGRAWMRHQWCWDLAATRLGALFGQ